MKFRNPPILNGLQLPPAAQRLEPGRTLQIRPNLSKAPAKQGPLNRQPPSPSNRSSAAIRKDLAAVAAAWEEMQNTRARDGVYIFLEAAQNLVQDWERRGRADRKARHVLRGRGLKAPKYPEPYAAVIACTCTADIKARSKWARALQYVSWHNGNREPLKEFMKSRGGINGCASLFARRLGRRSR